MQRILLKYLHISVYSFAVHHNPINKLHILLCSADVLFLFILFLVFPCNISLTVTFIVIQAILCAIFLA
ncbi:hypothetical protein CSB69_4277 [Morganella morganii]|nr:hypothetical protein CSB69_4277 [Morganella morganii]EMP51390.1 hypothetical protein C790_01105 [Morganella morganii SC01]